jgi:hypothetical protein
VYSGTVTVSEVASQRDGTSIPGRSKTFFSSNKRQIELCIQWMSTPETLSLAIKRPKHEADHVPFSHSEDKITWSLNVVLRAWLRGRCGCVDGVAAWTVWLRGRCGCVDGGCILQQHLAVSQFVTKN